MAVQLSYENDMQIAMPGMRSDSSLQNTDGSNAAQGAIKPGYVVSFVSVANDKNVVKQVAAAADGTALMGICLFSQYGCVTGQYEAGDPVNVMTFGRIWAVTPDTAAPAKNTVVNVLTGGTNAGKVTATAAAEGEATNTTVSAIGWTLTGRYTDFLDNTGATIHLAEVQLRNQTA